MKQQATAHADGCVSEGGGEVVSLKHRAVDRNGPQLTGFIAQPIGTVVEGDAVTPTVSEICLEGNGTVGETQTHQTGACWHHHMVAIDQRRSRDTPSIQR